MDSTAASSATPAGALRARVDHLVVMADSLAAGVQWCEATLGITPGPGGEHPLMGTHNRLSSIASAAFPDAYFEIIAIDEGLTPGRAAGLKRWYDMDDPVLRARVAQHGPQLIHWVANTPDMAAALAALAALGIARGEIIEASRMTPAGLLRWRISVREDGQRLFGGTLPTLIEWGAQHPAHDMPDSGVTLQALHLRHPQAGRLQEACRAMGLQLAIERGPARITAVLQTPRGPVALHS